ncbi:MAG: transglutaminase family protein [Acidimicrobiales bacterium]|nr:transglutaminase family protein [Acidimicrobiales bacterium]
MTYRVVHRTRYHYESEVLASYGETHLHPRESHGQQTYASTLAIDPFPEHYRERRDFFGNRATHFTVLEPHLDLVVTATSLVDVSGRDEARDSIADIPWEQARDLLREDGGRETIDARQYVLESTLAVRSPEATEYAATSFTPGRPLGEALADVASRLHAEFEFAPGATTVSTPIAEVLEKRAGVCQDFAHLTISALRGLGLAARYVSGYLETVPPPGRERLVGADVSHAWVSVFVPRVGWVDVDPTNDQFVNDRYVTVAWGRDYADVPPLKGVVYTEAKVQDLTVTVDVETIADDDPALVAALGDDPAPEDE